MFDVGGDVRGCEKPCSPGPMPRQSAGFRLPQIPRFGLVQCARADRDRVGRLMRNRHYIRGILETLGVWVLIGRHTSTAFTL